MRALVLQPYGLVLRVDMALPEIPGFHDMHIAIEYVEFAIRHLLLSAPR
jgi:hypothetical protein